MLRLQLLTATAVAALLAAPAAMAQTAPVPPAPSPATAPAATPATPPVAAPAPAAEPMDEATPAAAPAPAPSPQAAASPAPAAAAGNVIDVLTAQGNFTTLLAALNQAGLTETLKSRSAVTIFAPTDEAFAAVPEADRTRLMDPANVQNLRTLLLYHVIVADVSSAQIMGARGGVETANQTEVLLDGTGEGLRIDGATITRADIDASNGAIFAIDKVLDPAQSMAPVEAPNPDATPAATPAPAASATATTRPATPGTNAPNGQPAATTTTIAAPPVPNPTDGQVDSQADPARVTPPVETPDPADTDDDTPAPTPTPG